MGDRVIGSRPTNVQGTDRPTGSPPPAKAKPAADFNPAAKAVLDDNVAVANKAAKGAVPAVQLPAAEDEPITQADMTLSASRESARADEELNTSYKALTATLDPESKAKLVTAQKAWITFRDAETDFQASPYQGGSMQPMMAMAANASLTEQRTDELNGWKAMRDTAGPNGPAAAQEGAAERVKTADKALNAAYKKLASTQDPAGKAKLLTAQKAWLAFRDAECAFAGPAMKDPILAELTEVRTRQLKEALQN